MTTSTHRPDEWTAASALLTQGSDLATIQGHVVARILESADVELVRLVAEAYKLHAQGSTFLPPSVKVPLPGRGNRILALPGYLGGSNPIAGIKWIGSVPSNTTRGMERASAVIILNDLASGRPIAVLEGSLISARRTAAGAVLAMDIVGPAPPRLVLIGCGFINCQVLRLACRMFPNLTECIVYDRRATKALAFAEHARDISSNLSIRVANRLEDACRSSRVVSIATTAGEPHISDPAMFVPGSTIVHLSLRDLSPTLIQTYDNVVDDRDHVCQGNTSVHLTERLLGHRQFIRCTLGEILLERARGRQDPDTPTVVSPFGLGILDLAVSKFVLEEAIKRDLCTTARDFFQPSWHP